MASGFGTTLLTVSWAEMGVSTLFMLGRFYVCLTITRRFRWDWWLAFATYMCSVAAQITLSISVAEGLGEHIEDLTPDQISNNQLSNWIFTTFAVTSIWIGKLAVIAFILQIEGSSIKAWRRWFLWGLGISNVVINIVLYPIVWTQCSPTEKMWNEGVPGNCNGRQLNSNYGAFQGSYGAFVDLALAIYPMFVFWNLQLDLHVKIGLCVLFSCGVVATVCACFKVNALLQLGSTTDLTYDVGVLDVWASTEMWVVFCVSCVPAVRPLFIRFFKTVYSSTQRSFGSRGYAQQSSADRRTSRFPSRANESKLSKATTSLPTSNESDENILIDREGIMLTRKISVHYETSARVDDRSEDSNYKNMFEGHV